MEKQRENAALLFAASIIAAIRLRGEPIKPSPKLTFTIRESVDLAKSLLAQIEGRLDDYNQIVSDRQMIREERRYR